MSRRRSRTHWAACRSVPRCQMARSEPSHVVCRDMAVAPCRERAARMLVTHQRGLPMTVRWPALGAAALSQCFAVVTTAVAAGSCFAMPVRRSVCWQSCPLQRAILFQFDAPAKWAAWVRATVWRTPCPALCGCANLVAELRTKFKASSKLVPTPTSTQNITYKPKRRSWCRYTNPRRTYNAPATFYKTILTKICYYFTSQNTTRWMCTMCIYFFFFFLFLR